MIKTKGLTKKFSRNEKEFYTLKDVSLHVGKVNLSVSQDIQEAEKQPFSI